MILREGEKAPERTINEKYIENCKNLYDSLNFVEPKKVPIGIEVGNWPVIYGGKLYKDVIGKPEETAAAYYKFLDEVKIDYFWGGCGVGTNIKALNALGSEAYYISHDGNTIGHNQVGSFIMPEEDYPQLIEDPFGYIKNVLIRQRVPSMRKDKAAAYEDLVEALKFVKIQERANKLISNKVDENGTVSLCFSGPRFSVPLDTIFDTVRGFKNTLIDLRRRPELVKEATDKIFSIQNAALQAQLPNFIGKRDELHCGNTVYHSACFLNDKQFDEYFFSYFKEGYMPFFNEGVHCYLKGEGKFLHTLDRYRELPKGAMVIMLEEDDPFEVYKAVGDWVTIAAGMKVDLLKYGSKQDCIDYAKKCIDTFAPGGGFIFMTDRPLLGANDAKFENVVATFEFVNDYGSKQSCKEVI